jgi:hypothetical protein
MYVVENKCTGVQMYEGGNKCTWVRKEKILIDKNMW